MRIKCFQKVIDFIRGKHKRAPRHNSHIRELGSKILSFEGIKDNIDTLILGSSHAQLGYRAKNNEFNLGLSFQDLYYGYCLYNKYCNPKIKNVILFYSVFSPGNQTIKTNFADVSAIYKVICGINYQDKVEAQQKKLKDFECDYSKQYKEFKQEFSFDKSYRGNEVSYVTCFKPPLASERALSHYKNNQRNNNQTKYVEKIYKLAKKNDANLLVVIPPMTKGYKESIPSSDILYSDLIKIQKKYSIDVLNMYDTDIFDDTDFEDWDHLNIKGAKKLTKIINDKIKEIS